MLIGHSHASTSFGSAHLDLCRQVADVASAMHISAADSSDVGFNMACALLQLRDFSDAEQQLQLALRAGALDSNTALTLSTPCCAYVMRCALRQGPE